MFYEDVISALQEEEVRYLIVGGAAVILHGVPRMTGDLDIVLDLSPENVDAFLSAMRTADLAPAAPVDPKGMADPEMRTKWQNEKNLKALTFHRQKPGAPYRELDVVLEIPIAFEELYDNRVDLKAGELTLSLISIEHLKEIKRKIGREQDLADVESLDKVTGDLEE